MTREQVEVTVPDWVDAQVTTEFDAEAATGLASVAPGAEVTVYIGTWCGDSKREVSRFWRALDQVGSMVPFELAFVGVDRSKKEPAPCRRQRVVVVRASLPCVGVDLQEMSKGGCREQ